LSKGDGWRKNWRRKMSEEFFVRLRRRTIDSFYHRLVSPDDFTARDGIYATIEALEEMMVGEPIVIKPTKSFARRIIVQAIEQASVDSEEVIITIFRKEPNLTNL